MTVSKPLVSVIIPTYNGEKRISRTLNSIIAQDYENVEIILVDDVSTDNTVKVARDVLEKSGREFSIIQRTENGRQSASRNTGLKAANGKYVIFFDHDDMAEKNFVSSLLNEIENKNADLVFCGFKRFSEEKNKFIKLRPVKLKTKFLFPEEYIRAWAEKKVSFTYIWICIFRKSFLDKNNIKFYERCYFGEDAEFMLKVVSASQKISFIREENYIHTVNNEQQGNVNNFVRHGQNIYKQFYLSRLRIERYMRNKIKDEKLKTYMKNFYRVKTVVLYLSWCAKLGDRKNYDRFFSTVKRSKIFREFLLSSYKTFKYDMLLFPKSLMLVYCPKIFYWVYK